MPGSQGARCARCPGGAMASTGSPSRSWSAGTSRRRGSVPAKRSWAEVLRLWNEGYRLTQIAKMTRISRASIGYNIALGSLVLPERPWVDPSEVGISDRNAVMWAKRGLVQRSPGGFYHHDEMLRVAEELATRTCIKPDCENPIPTTNPRQVYCSQHASQGFGYEEKVLNTIRNHPGISLTFLYSICRLPSPHMRSLLERWEQQGVIRRERGPKGGRRYFIADDEQRSA